MIPCKGNAMILPEYLLQTHRPVRSIWRNFDVFREKTKPHPNVFVDTAQVFSKGAWVLFSDNTPYREISFDNPVALSLFGISKNDIIRQIMLTSALGAWRPTQDVIHFDDAVYDALIESDMGNGIPVNILNHFPAWSLWFDTPYGFDDILDNGERVSWKGFFVSTDGNNNRLNFMFVDDNFNENGATNCKGSFIQLNEHVFTGENTVCDAYGNIMSVQDTRSKSFRENNLLKAISLLTYVCAHGFDDRPGALSRHVSSPAPKKTKQGWRLFPAPKVSVRNLGSVLAEKLDKAVTQRNMQAKHENGTVRPHMRRAHWHGYWMGPMQGERKLDIRWQPPILVAARLEDEPSSSPTLQ